MLIITHIHISERNFFEFFWHLEIQLETWYKIGDENNCNHKRDILLYLWYIQPFYFYSGLIKFLTLYTAEERTKTHKIAYGSCLATAVCRVSNPDPVLLPGSGFQISLDPIRIRYSIFFWIRFSNYSGSGSGFSPRIPEQIKRAERTFKVIFEENLKITTKDRQKMKKATISF